MTRPLMIGSVVLTVVLVLASSIQAFNESPSTKKYHHANLARHIVHEEEAQALSKRSNNGRGTFYEISPGDRGACGDLLHPDDYFVALNKPQYGDLNSKSGNCGKQLTISYGGKQATAVVLDACPECPEHALDLSPSLFKHFASEDKGVIDLTWSFVDDEQAAAEASAKKKAEEDAANKKKKEAEDAANRKKAEEEAAANKKKAEAEAARNRKKAEEEAAAKRKAEDDKKKAEEEKRKTEALKKEAEDKKKADEKKAAKEQKAADEARQKEIDDQKQKDAATAAKEKKKEKKQGQQQLPPSSKQGMKGEAKTQQEEDQKETTNINTFNIVLQGMDKMVLDGHTHRV